MKVRMHINPRIVDHALAVDEYYLGQGRIKEVTDLDHYIIAEILKSVYSYNRDEEYSTCYKYLRSLNS